MLIKLNKVRYITVGQGASFKVERTVFEPIWLNPAHISKVEIEQGPADCPDVTDITWGVGNTSGHVQVTETPEQINALINAAIRGARQ